MYVSPVQPMDFAGTLGLPFWLQLISLFSYFVPYDGSGEYSFRDRGRIARLFSVETTYFCRLTQLQRMSYHVKSLWVMLSLRHMKDRIFTYMRLRVVKVQFYSVFTTYVTGLRFVLYLHFLTIPC